MTTKTDALKLALEAIELHLMYHENGCTYLGPVVPAIQEALAQSEPPEQEPLACVIDGDLYFHHEIDWEDLAYQKHGVELLYTSPPKREWVGLTDDHIAYLYQDSTDSFDFARKVDAKLKGLNHD